MIKMKHQALIIQGFHDWGDIRIAHKDAKALFGNLVSEIIRSIL